MSHEQADYWRRLQAYLEKLQLLEVDLNKFFTLLFSKDLNFSHFFTLTDKLKKVDGNFIGNLLKTKGEVFSIGMSELCQANPLYVLNGGKISIDRQHVSGHYVDVDKDNSPTLTLEALVQKSDLHFLFSLNAYDMPYCNSTVSRGVFEHFYGALMGWVNVPVLKEQDVSGSDSELLRFRLLEEGIPQVIIIMVAWLKIFYVITELFKIIQITFRGEYNGIRIHNKWMSDKIQIDDKEVDTTPPEKFPLDPIIIFFDQFARERKKLKELLDKIAKSGGSQEDRDFLTALQKINEKEQFFEFLRVDFTNLTDTVGKTAKDKNADKEHTSLGEVRQYIENLNAVIETAGSSFELMQNIFKSFSDAENLSAEGQEFCREALAFSAEFKKFLDLLTNPQGCYQLALDAGIELLTTHKSLEYDGRKSTESAATARPPSRTPREVSPRPPGSGRLSSRSAMPNSPKSAGRHSLSSSRSSPTGSPKSPLPPNSEKQEGLLYSSSDGRLAPLPRRHVESDQSSATNKFGVFKKAKAIGKAVSAGASPESRSPSPSLTKNSGEAGSK